METKSERFELRLTPSGKRNLRYIARFHEMNMSKIVEELIEEEAEMPCPFRAA